MIATACLMLSHEHIGVCWRHWLLEVNNMFMVPLVRVFLVVTIESGAVEQRRAIERIGGRNRSV